MHCGHLGVSAHTVRLRITRGNGHTGTAGVRHGSRARHTESLDHAHHRPGAILTEPFITQTIKTVGAVPIFDPATGPIADFPTAGYGATAKFVSENPKTVAAFQRTMAKATAEAADRSKIEPLLVEFAKVDKDIAASTGLLTFKSAMDATSIQRVPDVMTEFGVLKGRVDVSAMIVRQ
jgi:NitT/TauT family transport system substrate-binding protein